MKIKKVKEKRGDNSAVFLEKRIKMQQKSIIPQTEKIGILLKIQFKRSFAYEVIIELCSEANVFVYGKVHPTNHAYP